MLREPIEEGRCAMTLAPPPLHVDTHGSGPGLVFLPGMDGTLHSGRFLEALGESFTVHVPALPGWGDAPRDPYFRTFEDLSYAVLDVLDGLEEQVTLLGCSTGAWLAAEVATKSCARLSAVALVSPVGFRHAAPLERSYLDLYASSPDDVRAALYGKATPPPDLTALTDQQFLHLARAQEATAYYAWEPYMHNPSLLGRLHRVTVPTLVVAGDEDGFTLRDDHLALLEAELPQRVATTILPGVGHRVEEQAPDELLRALADLAAHG
jgi:pimeloyl-ACP methyl ester carboxylesterase